MKKYIYLIGLLFISLVGFSQPIVQRAGPANTVGDYNLFALRSFRVPVAQDTTALNLLVTLDSCGKLAYTYTDNLLWQRSCTPTGKKWTAVGQKFAVEDSAATDDRFFNLHGFDLSIVNGNFGLKTSSPTHALSIGDDLTGANTLSLYSPNPSTSFIQASNGAAVAVSAGSAIYLQPNGYSSDGQILITPTSTAGYVASKYYTGGGGLVGEHGIGVLDPIEGTTEFYHKAYDYFDPDQGDTIRTYMTFYDKMKFLNIPNDNTASKIIALDADDNVRYVDASSLVGASKYANGITLAHDTAVLGDSLNRFTYIQVLSHLTDGSRLNQLRLGNLPFAQSIGAGTPIYPYGATYNPATFAWDRLYSEANHDTAYWQYGGGISGVTRFNFDSVGIYGASLARPKEIVMPSQGVEALYQINLPRDTVRWAVARDGQQASVMVGQMDLGQTWGYNVNTYATSNIPDMPISIYKANLDFQRNIDNNRRYKMTGVGVAQYLSAYKTYQSSISTSTYQVGDYVGRVVGFYAYGTMYPILSTATKANTLAVSTVDTSVGFWANTQYKYTNDIKNGYGFVAVGDSDYNYFKGWVTIGGTFPTRQNSGQAFSRRLYVTGDQETTGTGYFFVGQAQGWVTAIDVTVGSEAAIIFQQKDSAAQTAVLGTYLVPANRALRGGYWRSEMFSGAVMDNTSTGGFLQLETGVNHTNLTKQWRNGNFFIGYTSAMDSFRLYKKLAVQGSSVFTDTVTIKNVITRIVDSSNLKPLVIDANGNVYKSYWGNAGTGGGGSGTVTDFIFTDGNGFDGTVTTSTSTPTLSLTTTVSNTRVMFSNSGAVTGSGQFTFTGQALQLASTNTTEATTSSAFYLNPSALTTGTAVYIPTTTITTGNLINLVSTSTAANAFTLLNINSSGANANSTRTAVGGTVSVTNTGTTSTNYGLQVTASGATNNWGVQSTPNVLIGSPTLNGNDALIIQARNNNLADGIRFFSNNLAGGWNMGYGQWTKAGNYDFNTTSLAISFTPNTGTLFGLSANSNTASALVHIAASATSKAQLRLVSTGSLPTGGNILAGNIDFISDDLYAAIATGPAYKKIVLADPSGGLTSTRVPFATTNGRLTDDASLFVSSTTLVCASFATGSGGALPATNAYFNPTSIAPGAGSGGSNIDVKGTFVENSSSTHGSFAELRLSVPITTGGAAAVTRTANLYIEGPFTTTVTDRNYAIYVNDGEVSFQAAVTHKIQTLTTTTTLDATHYTVKCDATGGAITINLPAAAGCTGRIYCIKKVDSSGNAITIDGNSSETIDGTTTQTISAQWGSFTIQSDGSNWVII